MPAQLLLEDATVNADAVIHFGAGKCRELPFYQELDNRTQILLVEAHPGMARELAARAHANRNIRVKPYAVAASAGEGTLYCYNLPERNSLRQVSGLLDIFPGLRELETKVVQCRTPAQMLATLDLAETDTVCLVIDTPGEELAILQSLAEVNQLVRCSQLILNCGREALYQGAASEKDILIFLEEQGFETVSADTTTDPDQPVHLLRFNRWKAECDLLARTVDTLKAELESSQQHTKELDAHRQEQENLLAKEREKSAGLKAELENSQQQHAKEFDTLRQEQENLRAEERQNSREVQEELQSALEGLREEHAGEITRLQEESDRLLKEIEKKDEEMRQFKSDLSVALRLQTMRENDLKELQERYASLLEAKKYQDDLLRKLQQRLGIASDCLRQLKLEGGEESEGRLTRNLIDALSGAEGE